MVLGGKSAIRAIISPFWDPKMALLDRYSLFLSVSAIPSNFWVQTADNIYTDAIMTGRLARFFVSDRKNHQFPFSFHVLGRITRPRRGDLRQQTDKLSTVVNDLTNDSKL
jgi:hypothetical protein